MTRLPLRHRLRAVRATELGGLAGDAFHIGVWQTAVSVADVVQLALVTHVLGLAAFGRLALAMSFVVVVGGFFDLRVSAAATTFGAERLAARDTAGLSGVLQLGYAIDVLAGLVAFAVVAGFAPLVGPGLVGGHGTELVVLYGCTLLISTADDSSATVLRLLDRFRLLATCGVGLELLRIGAVAAAFALSPSLTSVVLALIAYDLVSAVVNFSVASTVFGRTAGRPLRRLALSAFAERRRMLRMVMHTNVVSYARLAQVQLPTLLLGTVATATDVGVYKVGTAAASIVGRLADPAYAAVLPRLSRLLAAGRVGEVRRLVGRSTVAAAGVIGAALAAAIVLRHPLLSLLGGSQGPAAGTILVLIGIGQTVNGVLFWNTGLLYSGRRSGTVAWIAVVGLAVQTALLGLLLPSFGANGAAIALLVSMTVTNVAAAVLGLRTLGRPRAGASPAPAAEVGLQVPPAELGQRP